VTFFQPPKTPRKEPQLHHKNTTTSPQKTINIRPLFPKPPSKSSAKSPKSTLHRPNRFFQEKSRKNAVHLSNDNAGQALFLFAQHAVAY
jgi:hypothetical protein